MRYLSILVIFLMASVAVSPAVKVWRSFVFVLKNPIVEMTYERAWTGNDAKRFCPDEPPHDCHYTVKIGLGLQSADSTDSNTVTIDIEAYEDSKIALLTISDYHLIPMVGDSFLMYDKYYLASDTMITVLSGTMPDTIFFPNQWMEYNPTLNAFVGYYQEY